MSAPFEFLVGETISAVNVLGSLGPLGARDLGGERAKNSMPTSVDAPSPTATATVRHIASRFGRPERCSSLWTAKITEASAEKGTLTLRFDNGCVLNAFVGPRSDFNPSWLVSGHDRSIWWKPGLVLGRGGKLESHARVLPGRSGVVEIPTSEIHDRASFHDVFARVLGFPKFYGRNMNAWIDCLRYPDEDVGMMNIVIAPGDVLTLYLRDGKDSPERCPEIYAGLCDCAAFVNWDRMEAGLRPIIAVARPDRSDRSDRRHRLSWRDPGQSPEVSPLGCPSPSRASPDARRPRGALTGDEGRAERGVF